MLKQYVVSEAYTDNNEILQFENGKLVSGSIISSCGTEGYCLCLESQGYVRGYDINKARQDVLEAEENLEYAKEILAEAEKSPVIVDRN